jgi:hypothetical protein
VTRERRCRLLTLATSFALSVAGAGQASAQSDDAGTAAWSLRTSLKSSALFSRLPDDPVLFPDRNTAAGFWRFRLEPSFRGDDVSVETAVEQRLRVFSTQSGTGGLLPAEANAPYRIRQLDWQLASGANSEWRIEVDRAAVHARVAHANLTVGRQAIGWGRGVVFSAVDLFSPFTPLEVDREWRRGVDAVRADVKLADRVSVDTVGAFGSDIDHSAVAARLRGYAGTADVEVVGGWRAGDVFGGATSSAAVGDAEVHGELAVFRTPAVPGSPSFRVERSIVKAVAGGSYRLPIGSGVLVYVEYYYSGFGATSAAGILPLLAEPAFQERYLRGDTQVLVRHAAAALASYELSPELSCAVQVLQSPVDGSGVVVPSATFTFGDRVSLLVNGYVSYGQAPAGPVLGSAFGATPLGAFVQLRLYR